jgi:hypothetical protein
MTDEDDDITGKAKGGRARAEALTEDQRRAIARKAAAARWGDKPLRATHRGNFEKDFGIDVDCYVLNDETHTAVISQRGMGEALGLGRYGGRLPRFVKGDKIAPYVGPELGEKLEKPLIFQPPLASASVPSTTIYGYDVTILIDICKAIIAAQEDGKLLPRQAGIAKQAHIIVNASAKAGIKGLVYALAGYDATREEVVAAFKFFVREEAREYEKEFPDQLYEQWYRLYALPRPEKNKPWKFKHLTVDHVYHPLARSAGKIFQLTQVKRAESAERYKKLHQFLSDIGVKALRTHLGQLLGIAKISETKEEYEKYFRRLFGDPELFDNVKTSANEPSQPS